MNLWKKYVDPKAKNIPLGLSFIEFYDLLNLNSKKEGLNFHQLFCDSLKDFKSNSTHQRIVTWAQKNQTPILTTNFDQNLCIDSNFKFHHFQNQTFTDYYPWHSAWGSANNEEKDSKGFNIWHINGTQKYSRSIRLGLGDYMGAVQRARYWIHQHKHSLYDQKKTWIGTDSWLDLIFSKDLFFIGLQLDSNEVFLRWLLLERAKFFKKFPKKKKMAYYFYSGKSLDDGHLLFLESVGIEVCHLESFENLYIDPWV